MSRPQRDYCHFLDSTRYDRNRGCQLHDNAYGINGGGGERDRWQADRALFRRMRGLGDPMAWPTLIGCLWLGWFFYNYHPGRWLWHGQLVRRLFAPPE